MIQLGFNKITIGLVILFVQMGLIIGADVIFGAYAQASMKIQIIYFMLLFGTIAALGSQMPLIKTGVDDFAWFFLGFFATGLILLSVPFLIQNIQFGASFGMWMGFGLLYAFVMAFDEEAVFRYLLPKVAGLGDIVSNIFFGLFHFFVLYAETSILLDAGKITEIMQWSIITFDVITLVGLGFVWAWMRDHAGGIIGSTGSHFAYNCAKYGVLTALMAGVLL